jgi:hypothetical protein
MRLFRASLFATVLPFALLACGETFSGAGGGGATTTSSSTTSSSTTSSSTTSSATTSSSTTSSGTGGAAPIDKAEHCASTFGQSLTDSFGRIDGTVLAVVGTTDQQCAIPNSTHVVVQVTMNGEAYRMVANVDVLTLAKDHELPAPAWAEGWHPGMSLDYATDMGVKATDFETHTPAEVEALVTDAITLGQRISIYATSQAAPASAHLIHRNGAKNDGVIFLDAAGEHPKALMFRFANQTNF